jgi:hypothetical protein
VTEGDLKVTVEKELVSQAEEEDMEALLGTYVLLAFFVLRWNYLFVSSIVVWLIWDGWLIFDKECLLSFDQKIY